MADELAAGTPGATAEGAVASDSGTPGASQDGSGAANVDADELKKLRDIREQFLREKENTERIRRENEELRAQMDQANRASMPPTGYDPAAQRAARLAQSLQNLQDRDPETLEVITETARMTQEAIARQEAQARYYRELGAIPADRREEVERVCKAENLWPSLADDRVLARRFKEKEQSLAEQARKLQEQEERMKRGVTRTTAEPAPPANNQNTMTRSEFAQVARAAALGNVDAKKRMNDYDDGRIQLRDG